MASIMAVPQKKRLRRRRPVRAKPPGQAPGTLTHVGDRRADRIRIGLIDYTPESVVEKELASIEEASPFRESRSVSWINLDGLHDTALIAEFGEKFSLHPLLLEDVLNTEQRPKLESYDDHLFIVLKMLSYDDLNGSVLSEQVSLVLGRSFVLSFQEKEGDVFEPVRERIRKGKGKLRKSGADYLFYALIDSVIDHYFIVLEKFAVRLERLEEEIFLDAAQSTLRDLQEAKLELIQLHRSIYPLREVATSLLRDESPVIAKSTYVFLRDLQDHTVQVVETVESHRDTSSGLLDIYLSIVSNRMNEVMKVLTIIATIFIPLTFIAGIYGMNFAYMPELDEPWAYPGVLALMVLIGLAMLVYFRKKNWL